MPINISNSNINFKSKIKFIDYKSFNARTSTLNTLKNEVSYPWTVETMKTGKILYTKGIMECIGAVFSNNKTSAMAHLATRDEKCAARDEVIPFDINNIEKVLLSKINLKDDNMHCIILGAWNLNKQYLNQFVNLIKKYKMPFSILADRKEVHYYGKYGLLFNTDENTLYITNSLTEAKNFNKIHEFDGYQIEVNGNNIVYNTYNEICSKIGTIYEQIRHRTGIKEFFESQFNEVSLCKLDEWG